ncbi:MAG: homoserine dehydrogenase [Rhodobacteraceae bacterium]|nr:MAG: homoserine dehydrogenase [Paracoccaceae bacterium]
MSDALKIGIAGLGTVGAGVAKILRDHSEMLTLRAGKPIVITAVSARSRSKDRGVNLAAFEWFDDPVAMAKSDSIDVFVELIGGEDGVAYAATQAAIKAGKHVVTANKAMLAMHGQPLALAAEDAGVNLRFEAAVAGGIPIIKTLTESLAGNKIERVMGVMNGTCNYILTRMESAGLPYEDVFKEADALGYLEADPNLDVGGIDAAHKLVLLSSIAFGTQVDFAGAELEGIGQVTINDIHHARDMGFRIKLLGLAQMTDAGLEQSMRPCLVPNSSPLAQLEGGTNMVVVEGDQVGQIVLRGAGAGEGPTASAVLGDIMDIARGLNIPVFGQPANTLKAAKSAKPNGESAYCLRLNLQDTPGIMAKVSTALADAGISIDRMRQFSHEDTSAPVMIVTHPTKRATIEAAFDVITDMGITTEPPLMLGIVEV